MSGKAAVLQQLRGLGRVETRTALAKHGAPKPMFGVRFADIDALAKRHRGDHALALELWATRNTDARVLAMKIADPEQMSGAELDRWLGDLRWSMGVDVFVASVVARSGHAQKKAEAWRKARAELRGRAGWMVVTHLARDIAIPNTWFGTCLTDIARGIAAAPNHKREAMNLALIAIGGYRASLREQALTVADQIGVVEIDHGDTYCKTPPARGYIEAMATRERVSANKKKSANNKKSGRKKKSASKTKSAGKPRK
jgi:3-methyladenine DNA glycosylase AlkD